MSVDIASLVIEIDSTQAVKAAGDLDKLTVAGERAQGSAGRVRTATEQAGIGIKQSADASAAAARSATDLANSQGAVEKATRQAAAAWMSAKTANAAVVETQRDMVRQVAATTAELGVYQAKMLAATMAQTGMTEAQAAVALGFREAASAEKVAGAVSAETRAARALDAAAMRELVKAGKDFERDTVASAKAASAGEAAASAERTSAIMADRALEAAAQRELVAASKAYDRDMAAAQIAADRATAASAQAEAEAQAAAAAEVIAAQRARTTAIMEARSLEMAAQRELVLAGKQYDSAQVASAKTAETLAAKVDKIRVALDPMAAAQVKAAANMATLNAAVEKGVISQAEYITITRAAAAAEREAGAVGAAASAVQVAGHGRVVGSSLKVRESLVLMREAARGDMTRMAGSATILAGAFGLMTGSVLATVAAVALLVAPFAILAFAMFKGEAEISKFNGSLIATGHYSGLTQGSLESMSKSIAKSSDTTIGSTKKTVEALAASGKFSADSIASLADAAENYSRITHENADKFVKEYDGMKDHLVKWAVTHEDVYHDLTLQQIEQIDWLVKHGQEAKAQEALAADIDAASRKRLDEAAAAEVANLGWIQRWLHQATLDASAFWDALMGLGRPKTLEDQINDATSAVMRAGQAVANADHGYGGQGGATAKQVATVNANYDKAVAALRALNGQKSAAADKAAADAEAARKEHDAIQARYGDGKPHATKADPIAERLQALAAEAQGNRLLATSTDLTTVAGVKALAMEKALADAAKASRAGTDQKTLAEKFYAAELAVVVTAAAKQAETEVAATNAKSKAMEQATGLIQTLGVSQGVANQMAADSNNLAELRAAYDAAALKDKPALAKAITDTAAAQERKNLADQAASLAQAHQGATGQLDQLRLEISLIGASNAERAVALAQLKEERALRLNHVEPTLPSGFANPAYTQAVDDAKAVAVEDERKQAAAEAYNNSLSRTRDLLGEIAAHTATVAQGLGESFGRAGDAIGNLITSLASYRAFQAQMNEDEKRRTLAAGSDEREQARIGLEFVEKRRNAEVEANLAALDSFKHLFSAKSSAYKVLTGIETAYRAVQLAGQIREMAMDAIATAKSIANAFASGAANAAAGAAKMFQQLGIFAFPVVAAMGAVLVGLGLKAFGGGGSSPSIPTAEDRQKTQGTGSVLGDATAKSESIAHALDLVAANTNKDLEYSNSMLRALRNIDQNIGALTSVLARQLGVGGAFDTSGLGLGTTTSGPGMLTRILNPISNLLPGLFGTKKTTTLLDQGLAFDPQSLDAILNGGLAGDSYQDTATQTKKKFFGVTYSNKTKTSTQTTPLGDDILAEMQRVIGSLKEGVLQAAGALGVAGADAALAAFTVNLGTISFKDKTGQEIQDELNAVFGKLGDQLSEAVFPAISEFQKAGEGAFETLVRVARQTQVVDVSLRSIGMTLDATGISGIRASDGLVKLFGSLDDFVQQTQFFAENFLSAAEQIAPVQAAVVKEFARLGVTGVNTKDQFKDLVLGLDLTSAAGQEMYASLLAVAPAFAKVIDYLNPDAAKASADSWRSVFTNMQDWIHTLNGEIASSVQSTAQAYAALQTAALAARGGDVSAAGQVVGLGNTYLNAAKASAGSEFEYLQAVARTRAIASSVQAYAASSAGMATGAGSATPFSPATSATGSTAPGYTYVPKPSFDSTGSFTVAGSGPQDFGPVTLHGGEIVDVRKPYQSNDNSELVAEIRALRAEVASLREDHRAAATTLARNTGRVAKVVEDWDGAGLPPDRTAEEAA